MKKMKITAGLLAMILAAALILPAYAAQADTEVQTEAAEEKVLIGEKSGDSDYEVTLINQSGREITQIALRASYEEFSDNLLPEDTVLADQAEGTLWCAPAQIVNYVPPVYDIRLTFPDDSTAVLHTLPFGDADEITILTDEETGIVYTRFFSFSMNSTTDSLQREKNIEESGEAVLIADFRAKIDRASGSGQGGGSGSSGSSGSGSGGSKGGGSGNKGGGSQTSQQQCLDNGLMF